MTSEFPAPDVSRATRGRFLARHKARVIEQDDLLIVEFVDGEAWYTATPKREEPAPAPRWLPRLISAAIVVFSASATALHDAARWLQRV